VLQYKEDHGISKKDWRLMIVKGKWVPSRSASAFFSPPGTQQAVGQNPRPRQWIGLSRTSPPEGGGMGAVVVGKTIGVVTSGWPAHLLDLSLKYFLQEVISSVQESVYRSK
jgi:hypothetical protein